MAIECYYTECIFHASHKVINPEDCEGPYCFEEECRMNNDQRTQILSQRCVDTHTAEDIWEHLEEELTELLLAIKRVKREREGFENLLEELVDVKIEINTVLTLIDTPEAFDDMLEKKLDKFEAMLDKEKEKYGYNGAILSLVNRYKPVPMIKGV